MHISKDLVAKDIDVLSTYFGKAGPILRQRAPWRARALRVVRFAILLALFAGVTAAAIMVSGIDVNLLPLG